jgi:hypothetical protein
MKLNFLFRAEGYSQRSAFAIFRYFSDTSVTVRFFPLFAPKIDFNNPLVLCNNFSIFFSLKYLQVISLLYNDDFLLSLNVSIPTDDFVDRLSEFTNFWIRNRRQNMKYFYKNQLKTCLARFSYRFEVRMVKILSKTGFCHTFNFPNFDDFFNLKIMSQDFNRSVPTKLFYPMPVKKDFIDYPVKVSNYKVKLEMKCTEFLDNAIYHSSEELAGFKLQIHSPLELPSKSIQQFHTNENNSINYLIFPKLTRIDENMLEYSPEE